MGARGLHLRQPRGVDLRMKKILGAFLFVGGSLAPISTWATTVWNPYTGKPDFISTGTSSSSGGDNLGTHIATKTITAGFGITATTAAFTQTGTGSVNAVTITSTGTGKALSIVPQGLASGGYQNQVGVVTVGDNTPTRPYTSLMVFVDSTTAVQNGGGLIELWENSETHNDPLIWIHNVGQDSNPAIRIDDDAPDLEIVNTSTTNSLGLGKWEPFAIANLGVDLQVNSRAYNNSTFEGVGRWHPLSKGGGLELEPVIAAQDGNPATSNSSSALSWLTPDGHVVGLKGPTTVPSGSWDFIMPNTSANGGQVLYQNSDNPRQWAFTVSGSTGQVLMKNGNTPTWAGGWTTNSATMTAIVNSSFTTTSGTGVDVSSMVFSIGANENWSFEFFLLNGCDNTGGNKFALTVPSGATFRALAFGEAATGTAVRVDRMDTSGTLTGAFNAQTNSNGYTTITGTVTNGATPGLVQLQAASTTGGQTTALHIGTHMNARKI